MIKIIKRQLSAILDLEYKLIKKFSKINNTTMNINNLTINTKNKDFFYCVYFETTIHWISKIKIHSIELKKVY